MEIRADGLPSSGVPFGFTVEGAKPIRMEVFIGGRLHFQDECPDPPCHEMTMIPVVATGAVLQIVAHDALGARSEMSFIIGGGGGMPGGSGDLTPQGGVLTGAGR